MNPPYFLRQPLWLQNLNCAPLLKRGVQKSEVGLSYKINCKKVSHTIAFEGVNILQHEAPYAERFDLVTGTLRTDKSGISLPNIFYRIDF